MEPQLSSFYMNNMILELIVSRYERGLPIRDGLKDTFLNYLYNEYEIIK
jgi:hypothetical protein